MKKETARQFVVRHEPNAFAGPIASGGICIKSPSGKIIAIGHSYDNAWRMAKQKLKEEGAR